jgi:hypothetical protein
MGPGMDDSVETMAGLVRQLLSAQRPIWLRGLLVFAALIIPPSLTTRDVRADVVPASTELPPNISLDDALRTFRARGLDLLIAEAAVKSGEGAVSVAGASPNPVASATWGRALNYDPSGCDQCSATYWAFGLSDSAAIEDLLSGKKDLRLKVARNALAAAKMIAAERSTKGTSRASRPRSSKPTRPWTLRCRCSGNRAWLWPS